MTDAQKLRDWHACIDALLLQSDWTQLPDVRLTSEQKSAWAVYREALRTAKDLYNDYDSAVLPTKPGA